MSICNEWERMVSGRLYDPADQEKELSVFERKKRELRTTVRETVFTIAALHAK